MSIQGAIQALAAAFVSFYITCTAIGRPDIPLKIVTELRVKALSGSSGSWGCPSVFRKDACHTYDHRRYR
jgi:hypothetical protein